MRMIDDDTLVFTKAQLAEFVSDAASECWQPPMGEFSSNTVKDYIEKQIEEYKRKNADKTAV